MIEAILKVYIVVLLSWKIRGAGGSPILNFQDRLLLYLETKPNLLLLPGYLLSLSNICPMMMELSRGGSGKKSCSWLVTFPGLQRQLAFSVKNYKEP